MQKKILSTMMLSAMLLSVVLTVMPVFAAGPTNGNKVIYDHDRYMIVTKDGFRQWRQEDVAPDGVPRFTIAKFTEGMNQKAIDAKLANGWKLLTVATNNWRYQYLEDFVETDGPIEMIYTNHNIPASIEIE